VNGPKGPLLQGPLFQGPLFQYPLQNKMGRGYSPRPKLRSRASV
jgi:hypothetical protein